MVTNNLANLIVGREQIIDSMNHGGLNYTSAKGTTEFFNVTNGTAIRMGREDIVMAAGPMVGKNSFAARPKSTSAQATNGSSSLARPPTLASTEPSSPASSPPSTPSRLKHPKLRPSTSRSKPTAAPPATRSQPMTLPLSKGFGRPASSSTAPATVSYPHARTGLHGHARRQTQVFERQGHARGFLYYKGSRRTMGHEELVLANGPMTGKPLKRRYTDVWQKTDEGWVLIARQATFIGIDGGAVYGHPDPTLDSMSLATPALTQTTAVTGSPEDIKAIEALVHSNPSEQVTEDVSFTDIFGTVRFGREELIERYRAS
jgi:hypothetical protein